MYAYNNETFGPDESLGRVSDREIVLTRILRDKLVELNPGLPDEAYDDAVRLTIRDYLWSDDTGLPVDTYTEEDVNDKAEEVFRHVYRAYPELPSPFYTSPAA